MPFPARNVVGHSDCRPDRKQDPGELFDWEALAQNGVGLWPEGVPDLGTGGEVRDAASLRDVRRALADIGYKVEREGAVRPEARDRAARLPAPLAARGRHRACR